MSKYELFASKLKAGNFEWFEQFYPEPRNTSQKGDLLRLLLTEDELKSRKVEQTKLLTTYRHFTEPYSIDQGRLTKMMKIYSIKKFRERRTESSTFYYIW